MGKDSGIEWTHHTHNLFWGCVKVASGCKNCYAEDWMDAGQYWGAQAPRRFFKDAHYRQPLAWNRAAAKAGERHRVFCMSMGDLFERHQQLDVNDQMIQRRCGLWDTIARTPNLDWLLLTKRLERVLDYVPDRWWKNWPRNAWLGFSASTQTEFNAGVAQLVNIRANLEVSPLCFVSLEPLLDSVDVLSSCPNCDGSGSVDSGGVTPWDAFIDVGCPEHTTFLDWVIIGGESGSKARPMHPDWARRVRDDCVAAGIPFFFKQHGEWAPFDNTIQMDKAARDKGWLHLDGEFLQPVGAGCKRDEETVALMMKVGKKAASDVLDDRQWHQFPLVEDEVVHCEICRGQTVGNDSTCVCGEAVP